MDIRPRFPLPVDVTAPAAEPVIPPPAKKGPALLRFESHGDGRGELVALQNHKEIPFDVKRVYFIVGTPPGVKRGLHAHKNLEQVAVCLKGSVRFILDDGKDRHEVQLRRPDEGLHIRSMVWREMVDFSPDCVLLVLASQPYDADDYIRDYKVFLREVQGDSVP